MLGGGQEGLRLGSCRPKPQYVCKAVHPHPLKGTTGLKSTSMFTGMPLPLMEKASIQKCRSALMLTFTSVSV